MDNSGLNDISCEDIDARLSRYDEGVFEVEDNQNSYQNQLYKKDIKDHYFLCDKRKHKVISDDFSHPVSKFKNIQKDSELGMRTSYKETKQRTLADCSFPNTSNTYTDNSEFLIYSSTTFKSQLSNEDSLELYAKPDKYSNRQRNSIQKQNEQFNNFSYHNISANAFPKKSLVLQRSKDPAEIRQYSDSLDSTIRANRYFKNEYASSFHLNREVFDCNDDLKESKKIKSYAGFEGDNKKYYKDSEKNQPRMKNFMRISYHHGENGESVNSHFDVFPNLKKMGNRRSTFNTFTMHDARRIAPMVLKCPTDKNFDRQDAPEITDENVFRNRRKCWTRICWSRTKHSHALNISKELHAWKDRNAIMNSMKSPKYATKSKKKTFSEYWFSFLKSSTSRFELWNRTLKKIEGQFGTGVVSYFVFLRWLILLNFVIFILYLLLIILPYAAFALLPHRNIKTAPNTTLLTDEYLQKFPKYENVPFTRKRIGTENISINLDGDLLSNLGTLLDNYVPDEILDLTIRYDKRNYTGEELRKNSLFCEDRYKKEMANHTKETFSFIQDFLQGTGWLQSTILFLGFYPDRDVSYFGLPYNLPISFLSVLIVSFFLSLVLMVQYSSSGIQENILTQKSNYLIFSNILFCSWDYCIEDKKTADIRHKIITCEIKSNLAEEHRKLEVSRWSSEKRLKVYMLRATINIIVIATLFGSFYLIYKVVNFQLEEQRQNALKDTGAYTLFIQFLPPLVITALNIILPIFFYILVRFEMYDTRTQVNIALFRIVFLRLASVFVLVSSLYQQITCEPKDSCRAGLSEYCRSPICWETYVGQQLYKLVITDFLVYVCMFLGYDLPRDFIVQKFKCKVTKIIGRQVFDLPSQVLSLVYSQTLCWLGLFYSPLLPGISLLKFLIIFYIKKIVVLRHCVPAQVLYKASRSNSIFMTILMISFFVVTMIHGYSLTSIEPSPGCSPFRQYVIMIQAISDAINAPNLVRFMTYLFSGFFFIPAFLLLSLIIYYYWTVVVAHRKMTKVLKAQIAIEGRDKQFLLNRLAEAAKQATAN